MEELLRALRPVSTQHSLKKQSVLFYQGEVPHSACIVTDGLVKVYNINNTGQEQVVAFHAKGDIFPLPWIFGETSSAVFYYETITDCVITSVAKDILVETIHKNPALFKSLFNRLVHAHTGLLLRVTALEQTRAVEKILFTLYYLMFHYGHMIRPGIYKIELKLTQPAIASLVGLTRETTAKSLNLLKRKRIVKYKSRTYIVNKLRLEKYLGEDSFTDLLV